MPQIPVAVKDYRDYIYIGIDPGVSGGIAALCATWAEPTMIKMPSTEWDIYHYLDGLLPDRGPLEVFATIELVTGYVGDGGNTGSSQFKFGTNYGGLRMALTALRIPFEAVPPRVWQKAVGVTPKKKTESKTQFKNRLKAKAQQLFPSSMITLAVCDALLIAEYNRRKREGEL